jgi:hypothetical protein
LRYGLDVPYVAVLNYGVVWLAVLELGFLWRDGALTSRRWIPWAMVGVGLAVMAVLTTWFDYPVSMIGLTHAERSNTLPPTFALLALAVWQCGAMLLLQDAANRWLARPRVWLGVVYANSMVMTFYLWNMTAAVLAAVILLPTGLWPQPETLSTAWWWLRLGWVAACAVCLVPFLFAFRWAERPGAPPPSAHAGWIRTGLVRWGSDRGIRRYGDHRRRGLPRAGRGRSRTGRPVVGRRGSPPPRQPGEPAAAKIADGSLVFGTVVKAAMAATGHCRPGSRPSRTKALLNQAHALSPISSAP